jgi:hypothetical protein
MVALETGPAVVDQWVLAMAQQRTPIRLEYGADDTTRLQAARALGDGVILVAPVHGVTYTWVSLPRLVVWADLTMAEKVSSRTLAAWLRAAGWEPAFFNVGSRQFRAWRKPWDCTA